MSHGGPKSAQKVWRINWMAPIIYNIFKQEGEIVAKLLEVDSDDLYRNLLKPKIKVGNEFVTQGRNRDQESIDSFINDVKFIYQYCYLWYSEYCLIRALVIVISHFM